MHFNLTNNTQHVYILLIILWFQSCTWSHTTCFHVEIISEISHAFHMYQWPVVMSIEIGMLIMNVKVVFLSSIVSLMPYLIVIYMACVRYQFFVLT